MYTQADTDRVKRGVRIHVIITGCIGAVTIACLAVALALRLRLFGMVATAVGAWVWYFYASTQLWPWLKYNRFMRDMREGLSRENEARFLEISAEPRMADGISVYDFIVYEGDDEAEQRLYLWDADKPLPRVQRGERLRIVSFGNFVKQITAQ